MRLTFNRLVHDAFEQYTCWVVNHPFDSLDTVAFTVQKVGIKCDEKVPN